MKKKGTLKKILTVIGGCFVTAVLLSFIGDTFFGKSYTPIHMECDD